MEETQITSITYTALVSLFLFWCINKLLYKHTGNKNPPPSPLKLPIIGNLLQLGTLPHRNLQILAQKHGPLMLLHFGSVPCLIVSSAETAREIMKTHDLAFVNRPMYKSYKKLLYGCKDISTAPYGEYWRQIRSIFVLQLLSNKRVQSYHSVRVEETELLMKKIQESSSSSGVVNLSKMFAELSCNGIYRAAFGRKNSESEHAKKFLKIVSEVMEILGDISIGDFVPWLSWISCVNGVDKRVERVAKEMDDIMEGVIQEHVQTNNQSGRDGRPFVDILLEIHNGNTTGASIDRDSTKALILDAFIGGTDTISTALEWVMSELLRHPAVLEKLQSEVREIISTNKQDITNDDLEKMHYLKAVIKETLRQHPPVPLLVPRTAGEDVKINEYDVPSKTLVMINAWAIGRDPASWDEPEMFKPERFINSPIDYKGFDFEFIPFGAGRRSCPGISFAIVTLEFVVANLVHKFNWKLPSGAEKDLDMNESPGITVHRSVPLLAVASESN